MALTAQQIFDIINATASKLGFDFVASDDNLDTIPLTQPEQVNQFISAINPIIHDKIMESFGNRGFMRRFINKQKGGSTTRHISFGMGNTETVPTANTLDAIVGNYPLTPSVKISSINTTITPCATIDRRELSKVFTIRSLVDYVYQIENNISNMFLNNIRLKILSILYSQNDEYFDRLIANSYDISDIIAYHQAAYSGELDRVKSAGTFNNVTLSNNVDRTLTPFEYVFFDKPTKTDWYTLLHFRPEGIERYVTSGYRGLNNEFLIPVDAIEIEEYNRYIEMQSIPNCPGRYNIFFNSDISISINFNYPILKCVSGAADPTV